MINKILVLLLSLCTQYTGTPALVPLETPPAAGCFFWCPNSDEQQPSTNPDDNTEGATTNDAAATRTAPKLKPLLAIIRTQ
jgi:hypothetical protein